MSARGLSSTIGVVIMIGVTLLLATSVALMVGGVSMPSQGSDARFTGHFDATDRVISVRHAGGTPVSMDTVELLVRVDGEPLEHQPPVPYFAAEGFTSGPTGPFNLASDGTWAAGEVGTVRIASTNDPVPTSGSSVSVTVRVDGAVKAVLDLGSR